MLKNKAMAQKLGSAMFAGLMVLTAGVAMASVPASATTSCSSDLHKRVNDFFPDEFRASATCSNIDSDEKARAKLDRNNGPDWHSDWFTTENKRYYTGWATCYAGCDDDYLITSR